MLLLKSSHKEQPFVICLLWAEGLSANAIQSEMHPGYGDKYFTRPTMFGVKSKLVVEKVLLMRKNLVVVFFWRPMQRSQRSIPCGQTGMWCDKCLHEFGRYVEKWNSDVWHLNTLLVGLVHFSRLSHKSQCCSPLAKQVYNAIQHL